MEGMNKTHSVYYIRGVPLGVKLRFEVFISITLLE